MDGSNKSKMKFKILAAPSTYMLSDKYGSEESWSYNIMKNVGKHGVDYFAFAYGSDLDYDNNHITVIKKSFGKRLHLSIFSKLYFIFWYFKESLKILSKKNIDVIHHILPFGFHNTFNLLPLLGYTRNIPFVIGPLQSPHTYVSNEEIGFSQGNFDNQCNFQSSIIKKIEHVFLRSGRFMLKYLSVKTLQKADAIICINEDAKILYSNVVDPKKIHIIPPGIDINEIG